VKLAATIANSLWIGSSLPSLARFNRALNDPAAAQDGLLRGLLARNAESAYGRAHGFAEIRGYEEFARRVPLVNHDDLEPWIERIRHGEARVLTTEPVTHLIPTSGSTGARKLIPFTDGLQREFNRAIGPWIADLARQHPGILFGPAYWCITPAMQSVETEASLVPIGFADDASYLGGWKSWLARKATVAPDGTSSIADMEEFRFRTLSCLLRERDLRLISVWHPTFLALLLDALPNYWERILAELHQDQRRRARELERVNPADAPSLWPNLEIISCWGDGQAESAIADLRRRFPTKHIQPKGLLATEAFLTIPFGVAHPVAIRSHFFEFVDEDGRIRRVHELRPRETYEVVVTTSGGLWRYRLGDLVKVTDFVGATPSLRFVGRAGNVSDLCGEKLSESFVASAIQKVIGDMNSAPRFMLLAPEWCARSWRYTLFVEGKLNCAAARENLENELCANPNYALSRQLGQLQPLSVREVADGQKSYLMREVTAGMRMGDVKPCWLSRRTDWAEHFRPVKGRE